MKVAFIFLILLITKVAFAAGGSGDAHTAHIPGAVVYQAINVTLLVALLYGLTRKKVSEFFLSRGQAHEKAKIEAQKAFQEAQEKHQEVSKKLETLHAGEAGAVERARSDALVLKSKLILEAEQLAKNIYEDAKKTTHHEFEKAKQGLREEAFETALSKAKREIEKNLNKEDQKGLQKQFVENIGTVQ